MASPPSTLELTNTGGWMPRSSNSRAAITIIELAMKMPARVEVGPTYTPPPGVNSTAASPGTPQLSITTSQSSKSRAPHAAREETALRMRERSDSDRFYTALPRFHRHLYRQRVAAGIRSDDQQVLRPDRVALEQYRRIPRKTLRPAEAAVLNDIEMGHAAGPEIEFGGHQKGMPAAQRIDDAVALDGVRDQPRRLLERRHLGAADAFQDFLNHPAIVLCAVHIRPALLRCSNGMIGLILREKPRPCQYRFPHYARTSRRSLNFVNNL